MKTKVVTTALKAADPQSQRDHAQTFFVKKPMPLLAGASDFSFPLGETCPPLAGSVDCDAMAKRINHDGKQSYSYRICR